MLGALWKLDGVVVSGLLIAVEGQHLSDVEAADNREPRDLVVELILDADFVSVRLGIYCQIEST